MLQKQKEMLENFLNSYDLDDAYIPDVIREARDKFDLGLHEVKAALNRVHLKQRIENANDIDEIKEVLFDIVDII